MDSKAWDTLVLVCMFVLAGTVAAIVVSAIWAVLFTCSRFTNSFRRKRDLEGGHGWRKEPVRGAGKS